MQKKIANIVFYKFNGERKNMVEACFFYNDGTVANVTYEEAMKEAKKIAKEENATGKEEFDSLLNKNRIFVMSGEELAKRFDQFVVNENVKSSIDKALDNIILLDNEDKVVEKEEAKQTTLIPIQSAIINNNVSRLNEQKTANETVIEEEKEPEPEETHTPVDTKEAEDKNEQQTTTPEVFMVDLKDESLNKKDEKEFFVRYTNPTTNEVEDIKLTRKSGEKATNAKKTVKDDDTKKEKKPSKIKNFIKGKLLPIAAAVTIIAGLGNIPGLNLVKKSKAGIANGLKANVEQEISVNGNDDETITNYSKNNYTNTSISKNVNKSTQSNKIVSEKNNKNYNNYSYQELLNVTTNVKQKEVMLNMNKALNWFNGEFANKYVEEGKNIRAALSWDEMMALQIAYNDYSKYDLHAIFNGAEISANEMENNYKNATLQLMGAYVIEQEPNLVDVSLFVHSEEGINFAKKYQNLLEIAKTATGEAKLVAIQNFYAELYKDFPITDEIRTEGISHSDTRNIESYKLAVAPMVAAAEIMFQNYEIDNTLTDRVIDYFNDLGLCNLAEEKFEKIEMITLACCEEDIENPLYEQYKNAKIKELKDLNIYVIDDEHRDLSQLDRFQELVNWHFKIVDGHFESETWYTSETYNTTKTWTETKTETRTETKKTKTSNRKKAVEEAGEKKVKEAEEKVDKQIEKENQKAKEEAEKQAEKNRKEMQDKADKERKEQEKTIAEDDKDMQNDNDAANDKINNGQQVNSSDYGDHNVEFDDSNKDENGNLQDSVKDITTDGTGNNTDLIDPNVSGKAFDEEGQKLPVEVEYDTVNDDTIDYEISYDNELDNSAESNNENNNTDNSNTGNNESYEDLGTPSDDTQQSNVNYEEYEVIYDEEIDYSEDSVSQQEVQAVAEPAPAPQPEPQSVPEPTPAPQPEPQSVPEPAPAPAPKTNEEIVNEYVESQANQSNEEEAKELVLE